MNNYRLWVGSLLLLVSPFVYADGLALHALENPAGGVVPLTREQEDAAIEQIKQVILSRITTVRDAHPKDHGCVTGRFFVDPWLDQRYQSGVFAQAGRKFDAVLRFSSGSGDVRADDRFDGEQRLGSSQGLALKIFLPEDLQKQVADIPGEKYFLDKSTYKTFDIIGINGVEEFVVNDLSSYLPFFRANAIAGQVKDPAVKAQIIEAEYTLKLPPVLQPVIRSLIQARANVRVSNVLAEAYHSWVPYAFDAERAVKYSLVPCTDLAKSKPVAASANFLGEQLTQDLGLGSPIEGCYEVQALFHTSDMPSVEDGALSWNGDTSERRKVKLGTVILNHHLVADDYCEQLSFNPAHALPDQRGIGATQRARRLIYAAVETRRNENRQAAAQPPR